MRKRSAIGLIAAIGLFGPAATATARDRDRDRLPDHWEKRYSISTKKRSAAGDPDRDRLSNLREYRLRLHPRRADTDRDGLKDGDEVRRYRTNPRKRDTDGDGVPDGAEARAGSNPRAADAPPPPAPALSSVPTSPTPPTPATPSPPAITCDVTVGSASALTSQLSAAPTGQTICLTSGDYGSFRGASKSATVTIAAAPGANPSISLSLTNANNITLDGFTVRGGSLSGTTRNITIRNSTFTAPTTINNLANANVVFDHNTFNNINAGGQFATPARIHLSYSSSTHSGVTIQNSQMSGGSSDGVQTGVGVNIINNEFVNIKEGSCGDCHTDAIQLLGARGSIVRGNWIHDSASGIVAYDGISNALIEDNVVDLPVRPWGIELYSDSNSIVRHNTLKYGSCTYNLPCGLIDINRKSSDPVGTGTQVYDNIASDITTQNSSTIAQRHHNLVRRNVKTGDTLGTPTYTGGANPTTYDGYRLTTTSPGKNAASDGTDIGA